MGINIFDDYLLHSIKMIVVDSIMFLIMTISLIYLFVRILKIDTFVSEMTIIVIVVAMIVYVEQKNGGME
jgi:hypothetical protein